LCGTVSGVIAGLVLGRSDKLSRIFQPFVVAMNSVPRIALVPLIILIFGLGDMSKIVTAWIVVFFVVFFNTFEGTRAVDRDQIAAARLLGASEMTLLRTVVIPSALAWVFASLTPDRRHRRRVHRRRARSRQAHHRGRGTRQRLRDDGRDFCHDDRRHRARRNRATRPELSPALATSVRRKGVIVCSAL
jgi:binding-protein-dependent transport system inner membrane component